jgi:hypothetical protein
MKKCLFVLLAALSGFNARAAAGDTTWVQANVDTLSWYGNYDASVSFPTTGTYRNIYMVFELGKYVCPGSPSYCGDWDYTVQNFLMTPGGDTLELGRFITPYANAGAPRTPWSWKQHYIYDVTDYAAQLNGSATIRLHYSGYSGGFTGNIRFAFVEGTPDRDVTGFTRLWHGSWSYGGATDISTHFMDINNTAPAGTASADLKFNITGHGSDGNGCCEFYNSNYNVRYNGSTIETKAIWRDDCGINELYPQSGTWVYDRANWCPGAIVNSNFHSLPGVVTGTNFNVGLIFDPYTSPGGGLGSYSTEAHLIYHGDFNKIKDASIEDIISPTIDENHFRENPVCNVPMISVKNRGANVISVLNLEYGIEGTPLSDYTWAGTINPLEMTDITLPALPNLTTLAGDTAKHVFVARIKTVNGTADVDATNDVLKSTFVTAPKWDSVFRIFFKTNAATVGGVSETSWKIYNEANVVVRQRTGVAANTQYGDTISLPYGCYRLEVTDLGCDGLNWWAGVKGGSLFVRKATSNTLMPMNGYSTTGTYAHDFGCKFVQSFVTGTPTVNAVTDITDMPLSMDAYPNPARDVVFIDISGISHVSGTVSVIDAIGRVVRTTSIVDAHKELNISGLNTGVYTVLFVSQDGNKLQSRLMIAK